MPNSYKISGRNQLAAMIAAGAFTLAPGFVASADAQDSGQQSSGGQNVGQRIGNAISGQVGPAANNTQGANTQSAIQRGVQRAGQGLLQGQNVGGAVQQGLREGAQSRLESPAQTQNRDFYEQQQNLRSGSPISGQQTFNPQYYRDQNGQLFYFNSQGARVYTQNQFSANGRIQTSAGQFYGNAGGEQTWSNSQSSSGQRKLGVNVTGQENGVRIDQIVEGTVASNSDLQEGDIIRQIDGQPVRSVSDVINAINKPSAENDVQLTVMRDGEQQTLTASFDQQSRYQAARPAMSGQNQGSLQQQIAQLRQEVKQLRQQVKSMQSNGEMSSDEKGGDSQQSEEGFSSLLESAVDIVTDDEGTAEKETSAGSNPAKSGNAGSGSPTGQSDEDSQR